MADRWHADKTSPSQYARRDLTTDKTGFLPAIEVPRWKKPSDIRRRVIAKGPRIIRPDDTAGIVESQEQHRRGSTGETLPAATARAPLRLPATVRHFVHQEHDKLLQDLRQEIQRLKADNKDLHFKMVLSPPAAAVAAGAMTSPRPMHTAPPHSDREELLDANQQRLLQDEIDELRSALQDQRKLCIQMEHHIQSIQAQPQHRYDMHPDAARALQTRAPKPLADSFARGHGNGGAAPSSSPATGQTMMSSSTSSCSGTSVIGSSASGPSLPLDVNVLQKMTCRLRQENRRLSHELVQLKADLNDLLYSSKWTPEAFLMAKGYASQNHPGAPGARAPIATGPAGRHPHIHDPSMRHASSLPAIPKDGQQQRRHIVPYAFPRMTAADVHLPALKPKAPNPAGHHRNVKAVQKARHQRSFGA